MSMIEVIKHPLFGELNPARTDYKELRNVALLYRATNLAIESAFRFGIDLPVGAVASQGNFVAGRYYASDKRFRGNHKDKHAEVMAILDTKFSWLPEPDTLVVTLEPCDDCQDFIAQQPSIKRVGFGLSRADVAERGLVKSHDETIFERVQRLGYPYEPILIDDEQLRQAGSTILDFTSRDTKSGEVQVDISGLHEALVALNAA